MGDDKGPSYQGANIEIARIFASLSEAERRELEGMTDTEIEWVLKPESSDEDDDPCRWKLTDDDRSTLSALADAIRGLTDMARDGQDLIAIGEVLDAFEHIERGDEVKIIVSLDVGFRRGGRDFQEGLYACLRIDPEGVDLSELNTSYSSDVGSDRSSRRYAYLSPRRRFDGASVHGWLNLLEEIRQEEETRLSTSRDHV